jgi:hypothetical protein
MNGYDSLPSSAILLFIVGYAYLLFLSALPSVRSEVCSACRLDMSGRSFLCRLTQRKTNRFRPLPSGTNRVSQVLKHISPYMPRPDDAGRPSGISPERFLCIGFCHVNNIAVCIFTRNDAVPCFRERLSPVAYMILCVRFVWVVRRYVCPSQSRNTRYR